MNIRFRKETMAMTKRYYTFIVSILGVVAKRFSQSSCIFVYTPVAQSVCAYPKNETLWVYYAVFSQK
jgi:hypothetical protein